MHPEDLLGPDPDGGKGEGPLRACLPEPPRGSSGGPPCHPRYLMWLLTLSSDTR